MRFALRTCANFAAGISRMRGLRSGHFARTHFAAGISHALRGDRLTHNGSKDLIERTLRGRHMKHHRFWAWATAFCALVTFYTGYKHK